MPGRAFPAVGPLGLGSPRSRSVPSTDLRYYAWLRLPAALLGSLRSSLAPRYLACFLGFVFLTARRGGEAPPSRQGSWSAGTPTLPAVLARRQTALSSSRVTPLDACPALRPRWCPEHWAWRLRDCCLPGTAKRRLSRSASSSGYPTGPQLYSFRGSITRPAPSLPPAPHHKR